QVSQTYKPASGYRLGGWVRRQRNEKNSMLPERKARLEELPGWAWNSIEEQWEKGFRYLKDFTIREGHAKVSKNYVTTDGFQLGSWVDSQRSNSLSISAERKERLETLNGWVWDARASQWEEGFRHLSEFADRDGHCKVEASYQTEDRFRLGSWVQNKRKRKGSLTIEQRMLLEALPGWVWDAVAEQWEEGIRYLKEFADQEGHAKVSGDYKTADGYRLGGWVGRQRATKDSMSPERKIRLEALPGWVWRVK
ncbi:MAG: helicase associated domain-containing protein, partial [Sulfuricella sp.]